MSHDVSGTSTPVESTKDLRAHDSDSNESTPAKAVRVPVEVVVQGADALEPLMDPAEEVAMLLGESFPKKPTVSVEVAINVDSPSVETTSEISEPTSTEIVTKKVAEGRKPSGSTPRVDQPASIDSVEVEAKPKRKKKKLKPVVVETASAEKSADKTESESAPQIEAPNGFDEMGLSPGVRDAITTAGYSTPSPIQAETVPYILAGRDLMGQAETGSGKTAAFAWPLLSMIDLKLAKPQVLVLAPTRELAIQVTAAFEKYARGLDGFRAVTIYGGQSYETQLRALARGVQVVVGTPGRVMDHLRRKTLDLRSLKTLVLDEADEMLRMGFIDDVEWILEQMPEQRQILSFSATLPEPIKRIAQRYLNDPANVSIKSDTATADSIEQSCLFLHAREKMERLVRILETEETEGVLVFVKTRSSTILLTENLIQRGIIASALNGDIPQNQRERTVNQLKSGRINVVVATDVAARGLDVQRISHVINYDFPHDTEAYVHRIGRTGRAGRLGTAILFVEPKEKGKLSRLQRATNQRIEQFKQKSIEQINQVRIDKFKQEVITATENTQVGFFTKLISELQTESEIPYNELAGALAVLAQGESPLLLQELKSGPSNWKKETAGGHGKGGRERGAMTTYRVEVGRNHGVGPGNIVGAVTNEANLNNGDIGRINIFDQFSTIDLPSDIPQDLIEHLKSVQVSGQRLSISKSDQSYAKSGGRKSGPSHGGRDRSSGGKKYGDKKPYEKKPYEKKSYGAKSFDDKKPYEKKPYEKKAYGGKSFDDKKPYEKKTYSDKSFSDKKPYVKKDSGDQPNWEKRTTDRPYSEKKPFVKKPYDKPAGEKKSTKGKSNASVERTELGEKRDKYSREGENKYASKPKSPGSYSSSGARSPNKYAKPKPKTKAATRVQGKKKPDAKPSNPMKKYVKIRSAK